MTDFLFRGSLADLDPDVYELTQIEAERQVRRLILIPSESQAPLAVREALSSAFQNIYAEGYPDEATRRMSEEEILDYPTRLAHYRRYSDPRYYKGVEYADVIEALARRRCAEAFAANGVSADQIYVNVQALSGAPANNAVYHALVDIGDTVMGMNLLHGGHLSHGSSVNRSGKYYHAVHYTVDPETERIDYDAVRALALEHRPKLIIAGYSSYSWVPDWEKFRAIADEVGAYFLADISHIGGLVAAGVVPSPIGIAHVVTTTTHKTLDGPRGAIILTTDRAIARKIDRAVFPGEQGGPHVNVFAALALTFKLARTEQFRKLQEQTVKNAVAMADQLAKRGFRIPFGGTNCHMLNVDVTSIKGPDGATLSGDQAARILDVAGIVVNRNTIPGDRDARDPSGIRMGTPWITQRGFDESMSRQLADIIADLLLAAAPHFVDTPRKGRQRRAKVDFKVLNQARLRVRELAEKAGADFEPQEWHGYPHFYYIDDPIQNEKDGLVAYDLEGARVRQMLDYVTCADLSALKEGESTAVCLETPEGHVEGALTCVTWDHYRLSLPAKQAAATVTWLRDLSDGYVSLRLDGAPDYSAMRIPGPVVVRESEAEPVRAECAGECSGEKKPWFIGMNAEVTGEALPAFRWEEAEEGENASLRRTPLYEVHKEMGAKLIPFAGWEMPVWYTSVKEEHLATRQAAGLFDVAHMGVYQFEGRDAAAFLDAICANDCGGLKPGESLYTHFLTPDGEVIDDTLVYRRAWDRYLVVVNAANDDKDRAWFEAVRDGTVRVDNARPWARAYGYEVTIRNLRDPKAGDDMRVDLALQGPRSRDILLALGVDDETRARILALKRTQLCDAVVGGFPLIVSRTGYTGEKMAFELFVHPEQAVDLWKALLKVGEPFGLKPVGLGARDSLRTEAGLPLYGHEMGDGSGKRGHPDLGVGEAGFGAYVKTYKPWFIGREAFLAREKERKGVVVRFRFTEKGVRMAHNGDPVLDKRGRVIGWVTSCAIDSEGYLTGQAFVELKHASEGTPIFIYQSAPEKAGPAPAAMKLGDRSALPGAAVVVKRFL
ncbi:MAG: glycine cleavage system aminomethyltransferase GcvT [Anaerolineae bacterium]|nr:MAG: glycine cleavage system aminomethyltransferase GcvT [Anaerolineae bacterium]